MMSDESKDRKSSKSLDRSSTRRSNMDESKERRSSKSLDRSTPRTNSGKIDRSSKVSRTRSMDHSAKMRPKKDSARKLGAAKDIFVDNKDLLDDETELSKKLRLGNSKSGKKRDKEDGSIITFRRNSVGSSHGGLKAAAKAAVAPQPLENNKSTSNQNSIDPKNKLVNNATSPEVKKKSRHERSKSDEDPKTRIASRRSKSKDEPKTRSTTARSKSSEEPTTPTKSRRGMSRGMSENLSPTTKSRRGLSRGMSENLTPTTSRRRVGLSGMRSHADRAKAKEARRGERSLSPIRTPNGSKHKMHSSLHSMGELPDLFDIQSTNSTENSKGNPNEESVQAKKTPQDRSLSPISRPKASKSALHASFMRGEANSIPIGSGSNRLHGSFTIGESDSLHRKSSSGHSRQQQQQKSKRPTNTSDGNAPDKRGRSQKLGKKNNSVRLRKGKEEAVVGTGEGNVDNDLKTFQRMEKAKEGLKDHISMGVPKVAHATSDLAKKSVEVSDRMGSDKAKEVFGSSFNFDEGLDSFLSRMENSKQIV